MSSITYEYIVSGSAVYASTDGTSINATIKFDHLGEEVVFTATSYDSEPHGVEIYNALVNGVAGPIADYVEP